MQGGRKWSWRGGSAGGCMHVMQRLAQTSWSRDGLGRNPDRALRPYFPRLPYGIKIK